MLDEAAGSGERLARGFALLTALTFALIVLGALVRAHGAGLACPDWPLCFGELVPKMNLEVAFEWSHRVVAGSVALCFAALAARTWRLSRAGDPVRRSLALAAALLAVQILLGALTVWHLLAAWTVTSHLIVGNSIAAAFAWTALTLRERARGRSDRTRTAPAARRARAAVIALLAVQLVFGGLVSSRYAGLACPEWPTCNGGAWFPSWRGPVGLHLLHRTNGYLLAAALAALALVCRGPGRLARLARLAAALGAAQVLVGIANVLSGIPVEITGLHSGLAAALVLTAAAAAHEAYAPHAR
jgi:cytochrome c oxidase assembly protein subunit 15